MRRSKIAIATFAVISLLLVGLKLYTDYAIRVAEAAYPPVGQFVTTEGVTLHYLERGAGRPVVLIHGSDGTLQDFVLSGLIDRLATQYRVIAFDRPGHGYSGRPAGEPLTIGLNARLIHGALKELGVQRPILVGHSFGGPVSLQFAVDYPGDVGGLLLLSPGAFSTNDDLGLLYQLPSVPVLGPLFLQTLLVPGGKLLVPSMNRKAFYPVTTPPAYLDLMASLGARPGQFTAYTDEWKAYHQSMTALSPRYGEIRLPVTIIAGAKDRLTKVDEQARPLSKAIPESTLTVLSDAGHEVHYQHPEVVLEALHSLMRAVQP